MPETLTLRARVRTVVAVIAALALVTAVPTMASADPVITSLSGTVTLDTNANGSIDASTADGTVEAGHGGVQVDVVCVATGTSILSTTSDATGAWSFADIDLGPICPDGVVQVRAEVSDARYSITDAAGANQTPRTVDEQVGLSAPLTLAAGSTTVVNTLVRPDWYLDLTLPSDSALGGPAVYTGTTPFDSVCPQAGNDCAIDDNVVRSADLVTFTWAVAGSSLDDLAQSLEAVILEQTIELHDGALANFVRIPARCKPAGGGGASPASAIVDQDGTVIPEGQPAPAGTTSVTLRCNLGEWTQTGDAVTIQPVVKISAESPNGSSFDTIARAYAVDPEATDVPTAVPTVEYPYGPIDITAAPAYEIEKKGFFNQDEGYGDIGRGQEPGYYTYAVIQIKTNKRVGVEAFEQPVTMTEDVFALLGDGVNPYPGFEYAITQCYPSHNGWYGTVGGMSGPFGDFPLEYTVPNSGTCTMERSDPSDLTSDYTMTLDDIDLSGTRYPTKAAGEIDLSAGPYYVASWRVQVFIPLASIENADGDPNNETGSLALFNRVGDFDPDGISGASNFGDGREPGWCEPESVDGIAITDPEMPFCDPSGTNTSTPTKSDNVIGPTYFQKLPPGIGWAKYFLNQSQLYSPDWSLYPGMTNTHSGDGQMQPGQVVDTHFVLYPSTGFAPATDARMCDVFDNSMAVLVPSEETVTGGTDDIWAWLSPDTHHGVDPVAWNAKWIIEFAHFDIDSDDPLSGGFDASTGRYLGSWSAQAAVRCDDDAPETGWVTDPTAVPGGIDEVNAIRVRPGIDPDTGEETLLPAGFVNRLDFGIRIRSQFYGGPNDGEDLPSGVVLANFGGVRTDEVNGGQWSARNYVPSPENGHGDGDRITISRATLALQKQTITVDGIGDGAATVGNTGNAVAGNPIVWEILSSVNGTSEDPAPVDNLQIIDVLPNYADYDPDCTASITGGTPADIVQYDTPSPGQTTLTWNLGEWLPNTPVPNRRICTVSDPLAPQGTALVNSAQIQYEGSPTRPSDLHTVTLEQTGELKLRKTVDAPLDVLNDDQRYTMSLQNFSQTLTVGAPTFIEVFPFNGDATPLGGVNRSPASNFEGELELMEAPTVENMAGGAYSGTFYYSIQDPATIHQDLNEDAQNTWLTESELLGDFSNVTAIKFVGDADLTPVTSQATSGLTIRFGLQAGDTGNPFSDDANAAGDLYSDRFTAFTESFQSAEGDYQILASNRVTVRTVSHSVGDLIFEDRDGDGLYTAERDRLVPDGVTVNLYYEGMDGDVLVGTTTTVDGTYLFTELPPGDYHVELPASLFGAGGLLDGYSITTAPAAGAGETAVDENDDESHDAIGGPGGSVISNTFTLSASVNEQTSAVSGDEPTGENIHDIVDPTTTDPFSNLSIDLALQQTPGIDIEKEVCTIADNSCDPEAALGEGGWSVDGVDGVGPTTETTARPYASAVLWRIIVTNTGEQYLEGVAVTDLVTPECAATETDVPAFADFEPGASKSYTCETASITANITPNTAAVSGVPQGGGATLTDEDTANATTAGSLVINKVITGPGLEEFGSGPFTFDVVCTLDSVEVYNDSLTLTPEGGATTVTSDPISGLPLGSSCTVTETDAAGADATPAPVTVEIVDNDQQNTVIAEITNAFSVGYLELSKVLEGTAADEEYVTSLEFEVLVTCQVPTVTETEESVLGTVFSGTVIIRGGETVAIEDAEGNPVALPIGTHCFAEETQDGGATEVAIDYDSYENAAIVTSSETEQELSITATNTFDVAEIVVKKVVFGNGPAGPYSFELECTIDGGEPYPLDPDDAAFTLSHGETRTITVLDGVECAVTETDVPVDAAVLLNDTDDTTAGGELDGVVVADATDESLIVVTNRFPVLSDQAPQHGLLGSTGFGANPATTIGGLGLLLSGLLVYLVARRRGETGGRRN
ncbi:hypothetical protein HDC94_000141 [Leifsonia sp. AK011]|uniref:DUF5979 domain-containing protein n=1 Tax=Leifsonia sp. AK011 TaxID=2723075 RepID=UPI0015CDB643|nr:DUF5979 domain-containing protein [Leifsonia sp. AK011]NYF08985.1 hypothetical protein [Leifsonia sp. AK011]